MINPVLVEVLRGGIVESRHRGSVVVCDCDGGVVMQIGDIAQTVFPRSAVKAIQALPLIESGAADAYGFDERQIALACASHSGEPEHIATAAAMLAKVGVDGSALECGTHWPMRQEAIIGLARDGGEPTALCNNCSGKHSGFVCTCVHEGVSPKGYIGREHKSQQWVREAMEAVTGAAHGEDVCGIDGCSIPTYAVPLRNLAAGFARMTTGNGLSRQRAAAAQRIFVACMKEPFYVAGTDRSDTKMMQAGAGRIFTKTGAEGVFCAAIPELGLGIGLKCDDGTTRAAEVMVSAVLAKLLNADDALAGKMAVFATPKLTNWNGIEVGSLRPCGELQI